MSAMNVAISPDAVMGYGGSRSREWKTAIISPEGEVVFMETLGYSAVVAAEVYAHHFIKKHYRENPGEIFSALMVKHTSQMLALAELRRMTNLELVWGTPDSAITDHSHAPNGVDLDWFLIWAANGVRQIVVSGSLPDGWFEMDEYQQDELLEGVRQ
jgi:hypothetical protein